MKTKKTYTLSVPPRLVQAELHAAIGALDGPVDQVDVMAGSLQFTTPIDLCGLRAFVDHAASHAGRLEFECPVSQEVHNYLSRMDFYEDLPVNVTVSSGTAALRRHDLADRIIEMSRVLVPDDIDRLAVRVWQVARPHFGGGPMAAACATAIAAAAENVLHHAQSPIGALVAAQYYERAGLELAVVDLGLGIPFTLRTNPLYSQLADVEAVATALGDGVSSTGIVGRGAGLWELISAVQRAGNSTLSIHSGRAYFTIGTRSGQFRETRSTLASATRGTWISLRLQP